MIGALPSGSRIITNPLLIETVLHARSPARAKRRAARGHRQHYITRPSRSVTRLPDGTLVMHPDTFAILKASMS